MPRVKPDTYHAFLMDYASGTLPAALNLAGELHTHLKPEARDEVAVWEAVGGLLIELDEGQPATAPSRVRRVVPGASPLTARDVLSVRFDDIRWRRGLSGVRHAGMGVRGGTFMRLDAGQAVPAHGHSVLEATVVLEGVLDVDGTSYEPGDIALGVPGLRHKPAAQGDHRCICYVARAPRPFWRLS